VTDLSMGTIALHSEFGGTAGLGELFHTRLGRAFVNLTVDGHHETWPVLSHEFRRWLERKHLEPTGRMPNSSAVSSAIRLLECRAYDGPEREVHIRVASRDTEIYLDLADDRRRVVEIGPKGWRVIDNAPVHFVRAPEMRPLPVPETGGSMDELRSLINVDDDAFVLVTAWLLGGFRVGYEHPLLVIQGPEGSAKSALMAILEGLIDPSSRPAAGLPRTEREFLAEGSTRYLRPYDNITAIPTAMSNALCRHVTSGGHPIIIAGEDMLLGRDLADRSLFVRCDPKEYCLPRSMLLAAFETSAPRLIGAILDIFSRGLRELPNVQPEKLTRMADFELWATAWQNILWPKGTSQLRIEQTVQPLLKISSRLMP
jgi:hypothetical protein